ncbi:hypothetical protein [Caulobacter flavus]|uniref:hypothetical protein n=1 Tax=Caulobacter flavus TaxID=1679497 RepID=UPI0013DDCB54|nr:hypothetical protein [Caulobacter flavus]
MRDDRGLDDPPPTLDELLSEPIVRLLMRRDGVEEGEVRKLIAKVASSRRA